MADFTPVEIETSRGRVRLRPGRRGDGPGFVALNLNLETTSENLVLEADERLPAEEIEKRLAEFLESPVLLVMVAEAVDAAPGEPTIIGDLWFRSGKHRRMSHAGVFGLGVHSDWRGQGIGSAMIRLLLEWATAHPTIEKVSLRVFGQNAGARALYERLGFTVEGVLRHEIRFGPGRYTDDVWMCRFVKDIAGTGKEHHR